ncbi:hypothetical protein ACH4L5_36315 [Streptomyces sp. NPDC017405]|uniref:hypothetical protein n=1 Tax=unclassified Streptomyces TaxID=2593676 RepID=UPI003798E786
MPSEDMTVQELIDLLSACDRDAPVRQAINPFFPTEHRLAQVVQSTDMTGTVVYLAEAGDEHSQLGVLPPEVAVAVAWQSPVQPPPRRPRRTARGGQ